VTLIVPNMLVEVAQECLSTLTPLADSDWSRRAGTIEWSCRSTLAHLGLLPYSQQLALRAIDFKPVAHTTRTSASIEELLWTVEVAAHTLAEIAKAAPASARGFHPAGLSDAEGFVAMAIDELVIHTHDIASGLGVAFVPDDTLVVRLLDRLFPWWPRDAAPWDALLWANGRRALPNQADLGSTWLWHCAPLSEWDGTIPFWDVDVDRPMVSE
jgi:DinB superfamily